MKLDRVTLENFGIYSRKVFQFDSAPLVLIYGPNESGKTTALNGLRQALFGFKTRTPYLTSRQMSADVAGSMADGQSIEFSRRKGRNDDVSGLLDGRTLQGEEVQRLLCGLDLASYENLFGFSLDELRSGEAALKSARLSEALAGGGLGGISSLQQLRVELQETLSELYKSRGSTSKINVKLSEIKKSAEALRAAEVLPAEAEEIRSELDELHLRGEQIREQYASAIQSKLAAERLQAGLPKFRQRSAIERQLLAMDLPENIDAAFVEQWSDFAEQRKEIHTRLERERAALDSDTLQLAELGGTDELSEFEAEIEQLGHQAGEVASLRSRLSDLSDQADDAQAVCARLLETLGLEECDERLMQFTMTAQKRNELEQLSKEYAFVSDELIATAARLDAAEDSLAAINHVPPDADGPPEDFADLGIFVQEIRELERDLELRLVELKKASEDRDFFTLSERLLAVVGPDTRQLDNSWSVPSEQQIQQHQKTLEELRRENTQANRVASKLEKELSIAQAELQQLDRSDADTMLAKAAAIRDAREVIMTQWLDDLSQPLIAASIRPSDQRERLLELQRLAASSDSLHDNMLEAADALAAFNQKTQQIERLQAELAVSKTSRDEFSQREQQLSAEWEGLWCNLPFGPASSEVMLTWIRDFARWRDAAREVEQYKREVHVARGVLRQKRLLLQDHWPLNLKDDVATEALAAQLQKWQEVLRDEQRDQQLLVAASNSILKLKDRLKSLRRRQAEIESQYNDWLKSLPISIVWPITGVGKLIDSVDHLRRESLTSQRAAGEHQSIQQKLKAYAARTQALATRLEHDVSAGNPEFHAAQWLKDVLAMREQRTRRIQIKTSMEHRTRRVSELECRQNEIANKLTALSSALGGGDAVSTDKLVAQIRLAENLRAQIAELNASIEPHSGSEAIEDFVSRLEQADEAQLEIEVQELQRNLLSLDESRKQVDQSIGSLSQKMEQLANNAAAQRNQQFLQDQRGELAELSEQWVIQRLAQELLSRSIERFSADHEPALLHHTRDYFHALTSGRYVSVEHDNAKQGSFIVRNSKQESFAPEQLSTGTREQLYLAIRMAFITYHCEHHEPLPVIMDDCFVNFDDQRVAYALDAIANWDESIQTILLSCHWRVVQELAECAPSTLVVHLEKDIQTTAGELFAANQILSH